jgi:DNA-binding NarL/FixJ family response regulator
MAKSSRKSAERTTNVLAKLPLPEAQWAAIARQLRLAPQQRRIVELILRGCQDKQIVAELGLALPTIRTYLNRVFVRLHVADRMELVLMLFAMSHSVQLGVCNKH